MINDEGWIYQPITHPKSSKIFSRETIADCKEAMRAVSDSPYMRGLKMGLNIEVSEIENGFLITKQDPGGPGEITIDRTGIYCAQTPAQLGEIIAKIAGEHRSRSRVMATPQPPPVQFNDSIHPNREPNEQPPPPAGSLPGFNSAPNAWAPPKNPGWRS